MPSRQEESWLRKLRPGRLLLEAWILSVIIVSLSNVLAQFLDAYKKEEPFVFDLPRLLRFLILDLITAPVNYKWQEILEKTFPKDVYATTGGQYESIPLEERDVEKDSSADDVNENVMNTAEGSDRRRQSWQIKRKRQKHPMKKNWKNIWTKWFIDCVTVGAIFNTTAFLVIMGVLNGQPQNILHNLRTKTITIIVNGYKIWPFANIIAHSVIPFERRIPFFATVALFWNVYLSLVAARL